MKILILANDDAGLYKFRGKILEKLSDLRHDVYVSTPVNAYGEKLRELNCTVIKTDINRRGINPLKDFGLILRYIKLIKKIKPDKVITYTIKPNLYGGMACRLTGTEQYANVTGLGTVFQNNNILKSVVVLLYKIAMKKTKTVFFENTENRDIIVDNKIVPHSRTHCLNGAGVDTEHFYFSEYPTNGLIRFLFVGRIMREKGIDELLYAADRLKSHGQNVEIDIVGKFEDDYKDILSEYDRMGLINFCGHQNDVRPFIERSHCFVLPSYHEGMANTLLECGAMGRPLITSNIHGCLEAVQDEKTGYLCNVKDAEDLYKKMKQFMELPYEKKKEMGRLSHEYVASVFDKRKVVDETISKIFE